MYVAEHYLQQVVPLQCSTRVRALIITNRNMNIYMHITGKEKKKKKKKPAELG